jgi:hypothetical protein
MTETDGGVGVSGSVASQVPSDELAEPAVPHDFVPLGRRPGRVGQDGDKYYLAATKLDNPQPDVQFYDIAARLVTWVNGFARCQDLEST